MRRLALLLGLLLIIGCSGNSSRIPISVPQPEAYSPRPPEEWKLPSGLTIMFKQDPEIPLVSGSLLIHGGSLWEEQEPNGTVSAMGSQMRQGGAGELSADALDRELEVLSAAIGSGFSAEFGTISFSSLVSDLDRVFELFADVVLRPRFEESRLNLWKGQALEGIRRRVDDPSTVAAISFGQLLYAGTPYGRVMLDTDVKSISRVGMQRMHQRFVRPNEAILVVSGDIDRERLSALVAKHFAKWEPASMELPLAPPIESEPEPAVYFIKAPFAQATVYAGHLGVPRLSPDYMAIEVFNDIYGTGGFHARLMKRIRTELGLAYGLYGGIVADVVKGKNVVVLQTKAESAGSALIESFSELQKLQQAGPEQSEMSHTKASIENSFVFRFDSPAEIASRYATLSMLHYPADYDQRYIERLRAVTAEDVQKVARNRWDISKLVIVVVGNETAYNSVSQALASAEGALSKLPIRKARFQQKLENE